MNSFYKRVPILFSICLFLLLADVPAQVFTPLSSGRYWITFTDKNNSPYLIANPSAFLSPAALSRRNKQNIPVAGSDLPVTPAYLDSLSAKGAKVLVRSRWLNGAMVDCDTSVLNLMQSLPFVLKTSAVNRRRKEPGIPPPFKTPDLISPFADAYKTAEQTSFHSYNYGGSYGQVDMLGGVALHDSGFGGQGMVIAVLDGGFWKVDSLPAFDSLRAAGRILGTWDFVAGDSSVFEDDTHGMYVLSVMAANEPGVMVGTAPGAAYWLLRTEDPSSETLTEEYNWLAGAEFADSVGADIINSSLGYSTFNNSLLNHSYADMDGNTTPVTIAADMAAGKGMLVVNSAGNEGIAPWNFITAPADGDSVLAVGGVDAQRNYWNGSSKGPSSDGRVKPDVAAQGSSAVVASITGGTIPANGTSFAAPLVCGLAGCLWQAHPSLTCMHLLYAIQASADKYSAPDTLTGYGIPNFTVASMLLSGTDLNIFQSENIMGLFPNPSEGVFTLRFFSDTSQNIRIEIYDALGRIMLRDEKWVNTNSVNSISVNTENDAPGCYSLKITTARSQFTKKIIKI